MEDALTRPVSVNRQSKSFGEMTLEEVRARGEELSAAVGWGPTAKIAPVARAWSDLARGMEAAGAETVSDVGAQATEMAQKLWVIPPGGSFL